MSRHVIDVSGLPHSALDSRSPIWWGNLLLILVETTMFATLLAGYFYVRQNVEPWPPPSIHRRPVLYYSEPSLFVPVLNLVILLASLAPAILADRAGTERNRPRTTLWLLVTFIVSGAAVAIRFFEFGSLQFRWDENVYASFVWMILGMHLLHLITGTLETGVMLSWVLFKPLDDKHARDAHLAAVYWYWVVGIWLPIHAIVFWSPRWH